MGRFARPPVNWEQRAFGEDGLLLRPDPAMEPFVGASDGPGGYLHWADLRHRGAPAGHAAEDVWALVKFQRLGQGRKLPRLQAKDGQPFALVRTDPLLAAQHRIDTQESLWKVLARSGEGPESEISYQLMAAIEEAHASSAIEGAVTTRRQSRELIRSGREPRDRSERMVLNNFAALQRLEEWAKQELTVELICEIQRTVTDGTLDNPEDSGRVRRDDDVRIYDALSGQVVYTPPYAHELSQRLEDLCAFANESDDEALFIHPVTRAILLHHQLAYDHPFGDGNGRTARALFMWSILRAGYHWFRSLSISRAVYRAKQSYYQAFQFVQSDDRDVTYFVRHQMRCIGQEIDHLASFLHRRAQLERWLLDRDAISGSLNVRQLALIEHSLKSERPNYTVKAHCQVHGVSQPTGRKDLIEMRDRGLLQESREGRAFVYRPDTVLQDLGKRFRAGGAELRRAFESR